MATPSSPLSISKHRPLVTLACLLAFHSAKPMVAAQAEAAPKLIIVILEGEGAINNIRQRTAREPIVEVHDENNRPVAGAVVTFALPDRGAGGLFANGQTSTTITTDAQGRATATGLRPNSVEGIFQIRVTASYQGQTASAIISQTNTRSGAVVAGGGGGGKTLAIILLVAAGAAGGAVAATHTGGKSSSSPSTTPSSSPTIFTPGTASVSPPPH